MDSFDIVIVGAGPAGLSAAATAVADQITSAPRVLVVDDNIALGGQIWRQGPDTVLPVEARRLIETVEQNPHIEIALQTRVVMIEHQSMLLESADGARTVTFQRLLLCTGARERFLPYPGWTLPGVTGIGGLQALLKGGMDVSSERLVIAGSGPLLLAAAANARKAGAQVVTIAEQASRKQVMAFGSRLWRWPHKVMQAITLASTKYRTGSYVTAVIGHDKVEGVRLSENGRIREVECSRVACSYGLLPNLQLAQALNCALEGDRVQVDEFQRTSVSGCYAAGETTGFGGCELALLEGEIAGWHMIGDEYKARSLFAKRARWRRFADALNGCFSLRSELLELFDEQTLLCRCEDIRVKDVADLSGWIEAKLKTRCGMGACQGRVCSAAAQSLWGWTPPRPRPPYVPTRIETLAQLADEES